MVLKLAESLLYRKKFKQKVNKRKKLKFVSLEDVDGKREQNKFSSIVTFFVDKSTFMGFFFVTSQNYC